MKFNMAWYWTAWLFFLLPVTFGLAEAYSLVSGQETLSRYIWTISAGWPPFPWLAGFITGFLVCHFWWGGIVSFIPVKQKDNSQ